MLLKSLRLKNYRGFREYQLSGLGRVSLLVGKNNCGKTSVLEAVHLLSSQADPWVFLTIAGRRGEMIVPGGEERPEPHADVSHFFYGHDCFPHASLTISGKNDLGQASDAELSSVDLSELDEQERGLLDESTVRRRAAPSKNSLPGLREDFAIRVRRSDSQPAQTAFLVSGEGALLFEQSRASRLGRWRRENSPYVQFVTPESLEPRQMSQVWDKVITEGREAEVIQALRILEPNLGNVFFLSGERAFRFGQTGVLLAFDKGERKRVPLGSYGEGMRRLLALALSLQQARGGLLLIDEIDSGLHYSILGDMWLLLVNAAKQYNIQVFATTHSLDCIRGLAWLCKAHPELASEVSLQKIDTSLDESVALASENIRIAVEQDIEVR